MSIFTENITNDDTIVLAGYDIVWHQEFKCYFLRTKRTKDGKLYSYPCAYFPYEKTFYPADVLWKDYIRDGACNDVMYKYGIPVKPNKINFCEYLNEYKDIERLIYNGIVYYSRSMLWNLFDCYNKHVAEQWYKK